MAFVHSFFLLKFHLFFIHPTDDVPFSCLFLFSECAGLTSSSSPDVAPPALRHMNSDASEDDVFMVKNHSLKVEYHQSLNRGAKAARSRLRHEGPVIV